MNDFHRDRRKIDPTRADRLGDGTPNDNNRVEIGPTQLAFREWEAAGLTLPNPGQTIPSGLRCSVEVPSSPPASPPR